MVVLYTLENVDLTLAVIEGDHHLTVETSGKDDSVAIAVPDGQIEDIVPFFERHDVEG